MVLLVVCRWSLAGRCLGGGGDSGMACCELSQDGLILEWCQYTVSDILHTCGHWHLQRFSCPDRRSLDKEKAAWVAS